MPSGTRGTLDIMGGTDRQPESPFPGRPVLDDPAGVPVKASATVLVVRPKPPVTGETVSDLGPQSPPEVLLLRRNDRSGFVAGVHLYPGGAVDDDDAHIPLSVSDLAPIDRLAIAAAARECFEEAGILLAHTADAAWATEEHISRFGAEEPFSDALRRLGLTVPAPRFVPWGRWVTPLGAPRRYDTRFFVVQAPPKAVIRVDGREIVDGSWWDPATALAAEQAGELRFVTPTRKTLERLAGEGWVPPGEAIVPWRRVGPAEHQGRGLARR